MSDRINRYPQPNGTTKIDFISYSRTPMKLQVFAVKDRALEAHMTPWFAQTTGQAIRMFTDEVNNPQSQMNKHPDDYDLWHLGSWNDANGNFQQIENVQLVMGKQVKTNAQES